tara:strand:- start:9444 stop:9716 length:273 start_codon:yes stop_codon:yes gene_type:complete
MIARISYRVDVSDNIRRAIWYHYDLKERSRSGTVGKLREGMVRRRSPAKCPKADQAMVRRFYRDEGFRTTDHIEIWMKAIELFKEGRLDA